MLYGNRSSIISIFVIHYFAFAFAFVGLYIEMG